MIKLIPQAQKINETSGSFDFADKLVKVNTGPVQLDVFAELIPELEWQLDKKLPEFSLQIGSVDNEPFTAKAESYQMLILHEGLRVQASDAPGLYYAVQTLSQMQRCGETGGTLLPCCQIIDFPNFPLRVYHDDISRGQISTLENFKRILKNLGRYKINAYIPYIEDMLYLSNFPDIGEGRGRLTHEEVKAIQAEAKRHHVRVIPAFCLLGHCENLLAMPRYSHLARKVPFLPSSFDVNNPQLKPFLSTVIAEVASLFEDELIHGGFDEVRGLTCEEFCNHAEWVAGELRKHGKRLVIYYDMFINHFGHAAAEKLSSDIILANWNYCDLTDFPGEKELASSRHEHWVLTGLKCSCQLTFSFETVPGNIRNFLKQGMDCGASAAILTGWGDEGYENQRDINWNLIAYFADQAWSGHPLELKDFLPVFHNDFYGNPLHKLADMLLDISNFSFGGIQGWKLWHATLWGMERLIESKPELVPVCRRMNTDIEKWHAVLDESKSIALREKQHIDHYRLCLKRIESVVSRVISAEQSCKLRQLNDNSALSDLCKEEKMKLDELGYFYHDLWLRHNKPENLERSYSWYEKLGSDYNSPAPNIKAHGQIIDLDKYCNEFPLEICGIPKGNTVYDGILFKIKEFGDFSVAIEAGRELTIPLPEPAKINELHILLSGSNMSNEDIPILNIRISNKGNTVFEEDLLARKHIPDWYAPRGNMWAGSGNLFLDQDRVNMVWDGIGLTPERAPFFGLFKLNKFTIKENTIVDKISLQNISAGSIIHIVAITI